MEKYSPLQYGKANIFFCQYERQCLALESMIYTIYSKPLTNQTFFRPIREEITVDQSEEEIIFILNNLWIPFETCCLLEVILVPLPPLEARLAPSKILNFGVSGGCLGSVWEVSGGVKHCLDSVWAEGEGFLPVFFIIVS